MLALSTAVGLALSREWRLLLLLLTGQYALLGLVYTSFLPLHLAYINFVVGLFVGLILLVTVWQWPASARIIEGTTSGRQVGIAVLLTAVGGIIAWWLDGNFWLPWLTMSFLALGLLRFLTTTAPLLLGLSILLLLSSFQLFYLAWNQSLLMIGFFALVHLLTALATAYLMQARAQADAYLTK